MTSTTSSLSRVGLRELITHWRISPVALSVYGISSFVGALIALDPRGDRIARVALVAAVVTLVAVLVVVAGSTAVRALRHGREPGAGFLVIAVVAGAARATVMLLLADAGEARTLEGAAGIYLSSCFSAIVWLGLAGIFVAGQDRYRARYRALLAGQRHAPGDHHVDWDRHPDLSRMRSSIAGAVETAEVSASPEGLARASAAIRAEIEHTLRPLSHRLWFGAGDEEPHVRWGQVIRDAIRACTVPVGPMTLLWFVGSVIGGIPLLGAPRGVLAAVISTALLYACLRVVPRIVRAHPGTARGVVALGVMAVTPVLGTDLLLRAAEVPSSLTWNSGLAPLLVLALAGMLALTSTIALAWADRRTVLEVAARPAVPAVSVTADPARVSEYLHNSLQSELTGLAMQLDAAAAQANPEQGRQAIERIQALLSRSISEELASAAERPRDRALRIASAWAGICAVTVHIDGQVDSGPELADAVSVAEELIANAVRHSGATEVGISIDPDPLGLSIACWSNGAGSLTPGHGLGTHLIGMVAPRGIEVLSAQGGTVHRLVVGQPRGGRSPLRRGRTPPHDAPHEEVGPP